MDIEDLKRRLETMNILSTDHLLSEPDQAARRLGFQNYKHYLRSELWKRLRKRVLRRNNRTCECCWVRKAKEVHHRSYADEVMRGENDDLLVSVCADCHHLIHFNGEKWRDSLEDREAVLEC